MSSNFFRRLLSVVFLIFWIVHVVMFFFFFLIKIMCCCKKSETSNEDKSRAHALTLLEVINLSPITVKRPASENPSPNQATRINKQFYGSIVKKKISRYPQNKIWDLDSTNLIIIYWLFFSCFVLTWPRYVNLRWFSTTISNSSSTHSFIKGIHRGPKDGQCCPQFFEERDCPEKHCEPGDHIMRRMVTQPDTDPVLYCPGCPVCESECPQSGTVGRFFFKLCLN